MIKYKYRILEVEPDWYIIQKWRWYWPFWDCINFYQYKGLSKVEERFKEELEKFHFKKRVKTIVTIY